MKILQLTSYPTEIPQHGGQIRCRNIARELRAKGHMVKSIAVYVGRDYPDHREEDIDFGSDSPFWREDLPPLSDYFSGLHAAGDAKAFATLAKAADMVQPDAIISEHPWLMAAGKMLADRKPGTRLIYSSHNVESRLKRTVLAKTNLGKPERDALIAAIEALERDAVEMADLVIACTEADAAFYQADIRRSKDIVVAGNGVEPFSCKPGRVESWRRFIGAPFPIFVSSAHPPNANGFWDMMEPGLTFLRPEERVLVVGGVSDLIMQMKGFEEYRRINASRMKIMGRMDKVELQAIVSAAHVVLLPITEGEGSNLKTAEALESGSAIVATSKAFRGFERAMDLPHVHIADNPTSFRKTVRQLLDRPRYCGGTPLHVRSQFYWSNLLSEAIDKIAPPVGKKQSQ